MGGRPNPLRIPVCSLAVVAYKTTTAGGERIFFFFFPNRILLLGVVSDWNSLKAHWKLEHLFLFFFFNNNSSSCLVGDGRGRKKKIFVERGDPHLGGGDMQLFQLSATLAAFQVSTA